MEPLEIIRLLLLATHILGLAAIIGVFFLQMRKKTDFAVRPILIGAIVQLASGIALVGVREAGDMGVNHVKIAVKGVIALLVLVSAIIATVQQRKGGKVQPAFHAAGGLAVVNVLVAVLWQ